MSKPSPEQIANYQKRMADVAEAMNKASAWRDALERILWVKGEEQTVDFIFRATYKHFSPDMTDEQLGEWADEIAASWLVCTRYCESLDVEYRYFAQVLYWLTNSDNNSMASAHWVGIDDLKTGEDMERWGDALFEFGTKASEGGMDPFAAWSCVNQQVQGRTVEDLMKIDPLNIPPGAKW